MGGWEMAVTKFIPKHLGVLKPQRSGLPERSLGQILQENNTIGKYGCVLKAGVAGKTVDGQKKSNKDKVKTQIWAGAF